MFTSLVVTKHLDPSLRGRTLILYGTRGSFTPCLTYPGPFLYLYDTSRSRCRVPSGSVGGVSTVLPKCRLCWLLSLVSVTVSHHSSRVVILGSTSSPSSSSNRTGSSYLVSRNRCLPLQLLRCFLSQLRRWEWEFVSVSLRSESEHRGPRSRHRHSIINELFINSFPSSLCLSFPLFPKPTTVEFILLNLQVIPMGIRK